MLEVLSEDAACGDSCPTVICPKAIEVIFIGFSGHLWRCEFGRSGRRFRGKRKRDETSVEAQNAGCLIVSLI